jgi:hypothetical protein
LEEHVVSEAEAGGAAYDATVDGHRPVDTTVLRREADEADKAVEIIERKMDGWKQALADAKDAAEAAYRRLDEVE